MTGATLIVKRGNHFAMTKVRHDGYDIVDFKPQFLALIADKTTTPKEVCRQYLMGREFSGDDFAPFDPIGKDSDLCIFQAELENEELYGADDTLEDLINIKMDEMENDPTDWSKDFHPYDQLGCSYCDYMVYIDLAQGTIEGIDDEEDEEDENDESYEPYEPISCEEFESQRESVRKILEERPELNDFAKSLKGKKFV